MAFRSWLEQIAICQLSKSHIVAMSFSRSVLMWALICSDHKEEVDLFANEELDVEDEDEMDVSPTFSMENSDEQLPRWV